MPKYYRRQQFYFILTSKIVKYPILPPLTFVFRFGKTNIWIQILQQVSKSKEQKKLQNLHKHKHTHEAANKNKQIYQWKPHKKSFNT